MEENFLNTSLAYLRVSKLLINKGSPCVAFQIHIRYKTAFVHNEPTPLCWPPTWPTGNPFLCDIFINTAQIYCRFPCTTDPRLRETSVCYWLIKLHWPPHRFLRLIHHHIYYTANDSNKGVQMALLHIFNVTLFFATGWTTEGSEFKSR
jgi:hypothetical protein